MKSDGLKPDEIVAGGDGRRDGGSPRGVVSNHLAVGPLTIVDSAGEETSLIDLEPLERAGADTSAGRSGALREVRQLKETSEFDMC